MRLTSVTNKANMVLMNTTNNISEVLARNGLGSAVDINIGATVGHWAALEVIAKLLDHADIDPILEAGKVADQLADARAILAEVLR